MSFNQVVLQSCKNAMDDDNETGRKAIADTGGESN